MKRSSLFLNKLLSILLALAVQYSVADTSLDLFELDLSQLMEISVVSKRAETIEQAAGVVSVITREHIKRYGARNLSDLINRLPNAQVMGSSLYPNNRTSLRAVTQTHLDDKVLILLNGRPLRDAGQGGINGDLYQTFPIESIKQIEVIRGPGSVLYGTNAFSGVFNIVTEKLNETQLAVHGRIGSMSDKKLGGEVHGQLGFMDFSLVAQRVDHPGDSFSDTAGELGENGDHETGYAGDTLMLNGQGGGLSLSALFNDVTLDSASNLQSYPSEDWSIEREFVDLGYRYDITPDFSWQTNITYNGMKNKAFILSQSVGSAESFFVTDSTSYLLDSYLQAHVSEQANVILGASYDQLKGDNVSAGVLNTDIDTWRSTYYGQLDYQVLESLKLIAGAQYHQTKEDSEALSPRVMLISNLMDHHTIKVGYDEAYRSPFGLDLFLNASFLQGNDELTPETIKTWTLQHRYSGPRFTVASTIYQSRHEDLIVRNNASDPVTLENAGHVDYQGLELEYQVELDSRWQFEGNASYQTNESDTGQEDIGIAPNLMIKQGVSVKWNDIQSGLFASYFGTPTKIRELNDSVNNANPEVTSYVLMSLQLTSSLETLTGINGLSAAFYIGNVLDEEVYYPEIARKRVNSFPLRDGRSYFLTVQYKY